MPKTNADRVREYRARKKATENKIKKTAMTSTERSRKFRERKKKSQVISAVGNNESAACYIPYIQDAENNSRCQSKTGREFSDATFHRFPSDDSSKEIWIEACGKGVWKPTQNARICSKHFETSLLVKRGNRIFLKPGALPSKNIHPPEPPESTEYVNQYDYVLEHVKKELPEEECPQAGTSVNSDLIVEKKEMLEEQETSDNSGDTNIKYESLLVPRENQCNFSGDISKNSFNTSENINKHIKVEVDTPGFNGVNELYHCQYCDKYFDSYDNILAHTSNFHKETKPAGELSGEEFKKEQNIDPLVLHKNKNSPQRVAPNSLKCKHCDADFKYKYRLNEHLKLCHPVKEQKETVYKCDSCERVYKAKQALALHKKRVHYNYGRTFECWCGKEFRSPNHLNVHERLQHNQDIANKKSEYKCKRCEAVFEVKQNLTDHLKEIHYDYGRTFKCWCGKQYRSPIQLHEHENLQHKISDTNDANVQCDLCKKFFKTKQSLIIHIKRIHYDYGRKFECWCGKQFRSPIQLNGHKKEEHVIFFGGFKFNL